MKTEFLNDLKDILKDLSEKTDAEIHIEDENFNKFLEENPEQSPVEICRTYVKKIENIISMLENKLKGIRIEKNYDFDEDDEWYQFCFVFDENEEDGFGTVKLVLFSNTSNNAVFVLGAENKFMGDNDSYKKPITSETIIEELFYALALITVYNNVS